MFEDRTEAGARLADVLEASGVEADIVLGVPRGGLPVARQVADRLGVPLDVIVAKKMGAPHNQELAIGAVASTGSVWLNDELVDSLGVSDAYVEEARETAAESARLKEENYRGERGPPDLAGKRVVIVDDGIATGATSIACVRMARDAGADRVVLAVPVGAPDSLADLEREADEVYAVEEPPYFGAVGQFYSDFRQVTDEEAQKYLAETSAE